MSTVTAVPIPPTRRRVLVYLWIGLIVAVAAGVFLAFHGTAAVVADKGTNEQFLAWNKRQPGVVETASGLQYRVVKKGDDATLPTSSDIAFVNYAGHLRNGTMFDASQQPVPFPLADGALVPGMTEGLRLMPKGSRYRFWIKPDLAYGDHSPDPSKLPNGSLLIFDVEMLGFLSQQQFQQLQMQQMMQQQGGAGAPPPGGAAPPQR